MHKPLVTLFGLGLVLIMTVPLTAKVDSVTHRYELHIDPIKQRVYICELCDTASERIVSENRIKPETTITFQPGDEVDLIVDNGNPVLFKYEFGGVEAFKNADAVAVEKFFDQIKLVTALLPQQTPQSIAAAISSAGHDELLNMALDSQVSADRKTLDKALKDNPADFRKKLLQSKIAEIDSDSAAAELELQKTFDDMFFVDIDSNIKKVRKYVGQLPGLMKDTITPSRLEDVSDDSGTADSESGEKSLANSWTNIRNKVGYWELQRLAKDLKDAFKKLDDADVKTFDTGPVAIQIERYATRSHDIGQGLADLIRFSAGVDALGKRVRIVDEHGKAVVLDYDTLNDRKFTVKINFKTEAEGLPKEVRTSFDGADVLTGDFKIIDQPFHRIHVLGGGPAFVYSLIKTPQFLSDKDSDGNLVIKKKLSDRINGQDVAAMLNVIPTGWDDPFFAWAFQLGIAPKKDNLAAYVGTGALFKSYFFIGGGFVVQQVDRLAPGLAVGQIIAKAEDLKTAKEYKTGVYLHLTINLGTKK